MLDNEVRITEGALQNQRTPSILVEMTREDADVPDMVESEW